MRVGPDGFFELTYCTNIHPGEGLDEVEQQLEGYAAPLKERLAPGRPFGVGLRLSDAASRSLEMPGRLDQFKEQLDRLGLYVFTLNGFPYGGFHRRRVKDDVYAPDWRTDERLEYTLRLARILADVAPGSEGSISTSPISYKPWLDENATRDALHAGALRLADVAAELQRIRDERGILLHVGFEPEPDCLIEDSHETIRFFNEHLLRDGADHLVRRHGLNPKQAETSLRDHIRVCYDTCHFAVEFEAPDDVLGAFEREGIQLSKLQVSSALRVQFDNARDRTRTREQLQPFAESTYLHQVVSREHDGSMRHYPDLPEALSHIADTRSREWRIHYHVPIFVERYGDLGSTQDDIAHAVSRVLQSRAASHLEIETYTWDVLPNELKTDVVSSIQREYTWLMNE